MKSIKFFEIFEGHLVARRPNWSCGLNDHGDAPLAIYIEIVNMDEACGGEEYEQYPYLFSCSIVAAKPHESFDESDDKRAGKLSLIADAVGYTGGVPIDHSLLETDALNKKLMSKLSVEDAMLVTHKADIGTFAAQRGRGAKFTYPQFKTHDAAERFAKELVLAYGDTIMGLVGFTLDAPINLAGDDGWSVIRRQVEGKDAS